jgi:hypothetical protein
MKTKMGEVGVEEEENCLLMDSSAGSRSAQFSAAGKTWGMADGR